MTSWSIFIPGPVPTKGSVKPGKGKLRSDCRWLNEWTGRACCDVLASDPPKWERHQPVSVQMQITVERPRGHFAKSGQLNSTGRKYDGPTRERDGDFDKHARAVFDMLQMAGVLASDAQVVSPGPDSWMQWCGPYVAPGVLITVADFAPMELRPIHMYHYREAPDAIGIVVLSCEPDKGPFPMSLVARIVTKSPHGVTCRRCREMME